VRCLALLSLALCACPEPVAMPDAGRPPVDAGPPLVVDGGTLGPAQWGAIELTQHARTSGSQVTYSSFVRASFLEIPAETPNPCVERRQGRCTVRVCNVDGAVRGLVRRAGTLTLEGALVVDGPDDGPDGGPDGGLDGGHDAGSPPPDGGALTLVTTDAGAFSSVPGRLFVDGLALTVRAEGDEVPAFTSPLRNELPRRLP
jgi:hypothetical protein